MIVLDSDHVSILLATRGPAYEALVARMQQSPDQKFCTTIVTFEEHMRGWLAGVQLLPDFNRYEHNEFESGLST